MPLTRDRIIGHDIERLAFRFTMLNAADTVECQISDAAMDELAGTRGTESMARQAQFLALRDAVEGIASDMFDKVPVVKGRVIRIFTKHVQKSPPSPADIDFVKRVRRKPGPRLIPQQRTADLMVRNVILDQFHL